MRCTPKIKVIFHFSLGVFFMTNVSRETKLKAVLEYKYGSGSTRSSSIYNWKQIYFQNGRDGLMSLVKGRPNTMTEKNKTKLTAEQRLQQSERKNLYLRIDNDALKLLASMEQRDQRIRDSRK
jgi:transposase